MKDIEYKTDERSLVVAAFERLKNESIKFICCEVPLLGRCIDLAYIKGRSLISIEFKLSDWRRAINQARDHRLGADFSYICMPKREITDKMKEEFEKAGVGLVFFQENNGWPFEMAIKAPRSNETWSVARSNLSAYIREKQRAY